jgi:hypothetical protein
MIDEKSSEYNNMSEKIINIHYICVRRELLRNLKDLLLLYGS